MLLLLQPYFRAVEIFTVLSCIQLFRVDGKIVTDEDDQGLEEREHAVPPRIHQQMPLWSHSHWSPDGSFPVAPKHEINMPFLWGPHSIAFISSSIHAEESFTHF